MFSRGLNSKYTNRTNIYLLTIKSVNIHNQSGIFEKHFEHHIRVYEGIDIDWVVYWKKKTSIAAHKPESV